MSSSALLPCAILIPSLNRAHRLRDLVANIHAVTPEAHRLLFCVGDQDSLAVLDDLGEWYLDDTDDPDKRYVTRMNKLINYLGDAKTIFFGSDDVKHHPHWLERALYWMAKGKPMVVVNDLRNRSGTQALIKVEYLNRAVFDAPGLAFHPGYHHNFADLEMFMTAIVRGEHGRAIDSFVEHLHPVWKTRNSIAWDQTYQDGALSGFDKDHELYELRMAALKSIEESA